MCAAGQPSIPSLAVAYHPAVRLRQGQPAQPSQESDGGVDRDNTFARRMMLNSPHCTMGAVMLCVMGE
jgi:hypothetical protein